MPWAVSEKWTTTEVHYDVFASWDAEEFGIIGSSEWAEGLKVDLQQNAVAYLNVDIAEIKRITMQAILDGKRPAMPDGGHAVFGK